VTLSAKINKVEDIVVFLDITLFRANNFYMRSCSRNAQVTFEFCGATKNIKNQNIKHQYLI